MNGEETKDAPETAAGPEMRGPDPLKFPEDQIKLPNPNEKPCFFSQYDPATGWVWVGCNTQLTTFRSAWGFFLKAYGMLDQVFTQIEAKRARLAMLSMKDAGNGAPAPRGIAGMISRLTGGRR